MSLRRLTVIAILSFVVLACDTHDVTGVGGTGGGGTTVRVVNATPAALDVAAGGQVLPANSNLGYGARSTCLSVDAANPGMSIRPTGTSAGLAGFSANFAAGGSYLVIAYPGAFGATAFATLSGAFTPSSGRSGLRVFDALQSATNFDVYVTAPGAALVNPTVINLGYGFATPFIETAAGDTQVRLTDAGTTNVAADAGTRTLAAGQTYLLVVATPSSFLTPGCP
jgi:hypothetical protein